MHTSFLTPADRAQLELEYEAIYDAECPARKFAHEDLVKLARNEDQIYREENYLRICEKVGAPRDELRHLELMIELRRLAQERYVRQFAPYERPHLDAGDITYNDVLRRRNG